MKVIFLAYIGTTDWGNQAPINILQILDGMEGEINEEDYPGPILLHEGSDCYYDVTFKLGDVCTITLDAVSPRHLRPTDEPQEDIREIAEEMEREDILPNIHYIESEGDNRVRVDYGMGSSIFLNSDKTVDGDMPSTLRQKTKLRAFLEGKGFKVPAQDWT